MASKTADTSVLQTLKDTSPTVRYLLFGAFINQIGYFIQAYIIVFMLAVGFDALAAGWGLAIFSGGSIFGTLAAATLTARIGDRNTIIVSAILMAVCVALVPIAVAPDNPTYLWVASIALTGFFAQMYRPAAANILGHHFTPDQHVMGFSMLRVALNLGGAIGPVLATLLSQFDWSLVFWFNAIASLTYAVIAWMKIPDERFNADQDNAVETGDGPRASVWLQMFSDWRFMAFLMAMFLSSVVYIQFYAVVPLAIEREGLSLATYSTLLSVYALILISAELKISAIVRRYPVWIPATVGTTVLCLGIASFGITLGSQIGLILSAVILVGGLMTSGPTMFAYPARFPVAVRSVYISANQAAFSAGNAIGPVIGVVVFNYFGGWVWGLCFALAIISGALVAYGMRPPQAAISPKAQVAK